MYSETNWEMSSEEMRAVVLEVLGSNNRMDGPGEVCTHPAWQFWYPTNHDLSRHMSSLAERLDRLDWQIVTIRKEQVDSPQHKFLIVAPMIAVKSDILYHVTRVKTIPYIFRDGLFPSNESRSLTKFPETFGKIHGCVELTTKPGTGDGADFWVKKHELLYSEPFAIIRVDLTGLSSMARVYRDTHSNWGIVIDRIDQIEPRYLREVSHSEITSEPGKPLEPHPRSG